MSSNISPENEQFIENVVSVGLYHDRAEALDRAIELLRHREQLIRDVNKGIEQLERGEGVPLEIEKIKTEVRHHLETPWRSVQQRPPFHSVDVTDKRV